MDCIDCAADEPVVNAVNEGIDAAMSISMVNRPWVMISVNDDKEDLHFRKAGRTIALSGQIVNLILAHVLRVIDRVHFHFPCLYSHLVSDFTTATRYYACH